MNRVCSAVCLTVFSTILSSAAVSGQEYQSSALGRQVLGCLRDGNMDTALSLIGRSADLMVPPDNRYHDGLAPAVGGLYRALAQMSPDEQYDRLYEWTVPSDTRGTVRVLTAVVPEDAPPREFARALGERPRSTSFAVASIGDVRGLFCSAWMLVNAADEIGSLRRLTGQLEELAVNNVPNAEFVLTLARIRDGRSNVAPLLEYLKSRVSGGGDVPTPSERSDTVLVAAAMTRQDLGSVAEQLVEKMNQFSLQDRTSGFVPFLRRLRAYVILTNRSPDADQGAFFQDLPSLWISAGDPRNIRHAVGAGDAVWLTHERHVTRVAGPGDDVLLFRYPLTGSFEFRAEVAELEHGSGGLTYGGLAFDASASGFYLHELQQGHVQRFNWPFVARQEHRLFNRVSIRNETEHVAFSSNRHTGWTARLADMTSCPFPGLRAVGHGRIIFRNVEIVGAPRIPQQVSLCHPSHLMGWVSTYGQPIANSLSADSSPRLNTASDPVWSMTDGEIRANAASQDEKDKTYHNQLVHIRPLQHGETVAYDFYRDASATAHPTIGRLAFLLDPDGVRLRWLTDGASEWTGLPDDNAIVEALNRRGPRQLPLKTDDWNHIQISLTGDIFTITLNGESVYERSLENITGRHFGFYHDQNTSSLRVRNVVLTGDWPSLLTDEQMQNLLAF